jgi:hypothetical protein
MDRETDEEGRKRQADRLRAGVAGLRDEGIEGGGKG